MSPARQRRARLRGARAVASESRRDRGNAEIAVGLFPGEAGEQCRLVVGGDAVGLLDGGCDLARQVTRQTEAYVYRFQEPVLEGLVVEADGGLEGADEVADHVLRRIVQQSCELPALFPLRIERARNLLDEHRVLGDGECVVTAMSGRSSARHARQSVRDVLDGDIVRRGREQVEAATREHPLPGTRPLVLSLSVPLISSVP
jgi:hypothetical protein